MSDTEAALTEFEGRIQAHYGNRLVAIHRIDRNRQLEVLDQSDVEVVVELHGSDWAPLAEYDLLGDMAFDVTLNHGVYVRAWQLPRTAWENPDLADYPDLVREFRKYAQPASVAA